MTMTDTKRQREILDAWHERKLPANAFEDDPSAKSYDVNGKVAHKTNSNLSQSRWDLGEFPPNA